MRAGPGGTGQEIRMILGGFRGILEGFRENRGGVRRDLVLGVATRVPLKRGSAEYYSRTVSNATLGDATLVF